MKTILLATHNKGKIKRYRALFSGLENLRLVTLEELKIDFKAAEPFHTPAENSAYKAKEYAKLSLLPTIAIDEAVTTNFLPENEQPGVFVRRLNKNRELNDAEVLAAWKRIFSLYPSSNRRFIWNFSLSYYDPASDRLETVEATQANTVTEEFSKIINPGYPMSSFLIPEGFDRPHSELNKEESLLIDRKRLKPFLDFMKNLTL